MIMKFPRGKISGVHLVIPKNEVRFDSEVDQYNFTNAQSKKLKLVMGYDRRRVVASDTSSSDLVIAGFKSLINGKELDLSSVDAMVLITQTPDYLMPGTSFVVHGALPFKKDMVCIDINQGCSGFISGMTTALSLLWQENINRVAVVNVDVLSRLVGAGDRNSRPIIGDAASITIVDDSVNSNDITALNYVDGSGWDALMIPAGGMKIRPSSETKKLTQDQNGNVRCLDDLVMKGDAVFNFVLREVPPLVEEILSEAKVMKDDVDFFIFHQPNPFMLKKLANKLEIPIEKMPHKLVSHYGNSSGVTIPAVLCTNFEKNDFVKPKKLCFAGFGVGLSWGSLVIDIENPMFMSVMEF